LKSKIKAIALAWQSRHLKEAVIHQPLRVDTAPSLQRR
jgi:hypothetical protein